MTRVATWVAPRVAPVLEPGGEAREVGSGGSVGHIEGVNNRGLARLAGRLM